VGRPYATKVGLNASIGIEIPSVHWTLLLEWWMWHKVTQSCRLHKIYCQCSIFSLHDNCTKLDSTNCKP